MRKRRTGVVQINPQSLSERAQFYSRVEGKAILKHRGSTSVCRGDLLQIIERLPNRDYVAVLGVYVVEVRLVSVRVAVAYGLAGDDGAEAVLEGVDSGCADTS